MEATPEVLINCIIQIHLCLVYFNAGIAKMMGDDIFQGEVFGM
jgi:hypothetical protein